jgi:hypothetical protein
VTAAQRAAVVALALCLALAGGIATLVWPRLFDSTPAGTGRLLSARCGDGPARGCTARVLEISRGRYWIEAGTPAANHVTLDFELAPSAPAGALLLPARADDLAVALRRGDGIPIRTGEAGGGVRRRVLRFEGSEAAGRVSVALERPGGSPGPMRVAEVGLFASDAGLLRDPRPFLRSMPDRRFYYGGLGRLCLAFAVVGLAATLLLPPSPARWLAPVFAMVLTLAATSLEVWVVHNPYWHRAEDLRVMLASGPVQEGIGANLNYGMHLGSRLLRGEGVTFGPGWVPWERMPGYAFFGALAGLLAGFRTDIFTIGLYSVMMHVAFLALANGVFVAAAARVMRPAAALAVALAVAFMPNQLANTQADSIMVPTYLLTAAALCVYLGRARRSALPPLGHHLLVHAAFANWFLMRPDGVVGWAAVSLLLYWRRWRYLALPAALYLAIGLSWGAYKHQYTGEFSMTTNTVGDNAWIGLWQVPSKFRWQTADPSYFAWAEAKGVPPTSKRASDTALREVARFALTYPVYVGHLALHRFLEFVDVNVLNGVLVYPHVVYERLRGPGVVALLTVFVLCLVLRHEADRSLLVGWPLLFSLPLFLLFFSDGMRHIAPVTAALFAAALPPLLEPEFYRTVWRRQRVAAAVATAVAALWMGGRWLDDAILASDRVRYWTPFLDPAPFAWYLR